MNMDKNTYETYEYLPIDDSEAGAEQFFIVQDDGTFLINRQVQYVTQVQEDKEVLDGVESCTVYDVTPQQFYVDVDHVNSTELISVPDNFIIPENGGNIYGNSYLLQAVSNTSSQVEKDAVDNQFNQTESQADVDVTDVNKKSSNCTEITLSDDQYKMLEEKGWILLETNEKVYILDTLGLHDITTNHELIQQLKSESKCNTTSDIDSRQELSTLKLDSKETQNSSEQQETVDYVIDNGMSQNESKITDIPITSTNKQDEPGTEIPKQKELLEMTPPEPKQEVSKEVDPQKVQEKKSGKTVKIKTKFTFKDIPDKIILGKTINGKNLVARLKRPISNSIKSSNNQVKPDGVPLELPKLSKAPSRLKSILKKEQPYTGLFAWQFDKLIKQIVQEGESTACTAEQVVAAGEVIEQLLEIPHFYPTIIETNIVVTKTVKSNKMDENFDDMKTSLVTGRVTLLSDRLRFVHIPDLLQNLLCGKVMSKRILNADGTATCPAESDDCIVLNVHITETKRTDGVNSLSITLNKRQLPCTIAYVGRKRNTIVFACSSCATVFDSEDELTVHQVTHCVDLDDELTIDTDKMVEDNVKLNPYYIVKTDKGTQYTCLYCSIKFNKLSNCLRHVKTHLTPAKDSSKELSVDESNVKVYKCKMCSSSYHHPSSLSKHIVSAHIKVNKK